MPCIAGGGASEAEPRGPPTPLEVMVAQQAGFVTHAERMRAISLVAALLKGCYPAPAKVPLGAGEVSTAPGFPDRWLRIQGGPGRGRVRIQVHCKSIPCQYPPQSSGWAGFIVNSEGDHFKAKVADGFH